MIGCVILSAIGIVAIVTMTVYIISRIVRYFQELNRKVRLLDDRIGWTRESVSSNAVEIRRLRELLEGKDK